MTLGTQSSTHYKEMSSDCLFCKMTIILFFNGSLTKNGTDEISIPLFIIYRKVEITNRSHKFCVTNSDTVPWDYSSSSFQVQLTNLNSPLLSHSNTMVSAFVAPS